jgi:hypothetical protein
MIEDPLSIPAKTVSYAQYDAVRILNSLMEALRIDQSSFERLIGKMLSLPARCFFRSRRLISSPTVRSRECINSFVARIKVNPRAMAVRRNRRGHRRHNQRTHLTSPSGLVEFLPDRIARITNSKL